MHLDLQAIEAARERIAPYVRRTPVMAARPLHDRPFATEHLTFKLELLQVTGSFKARGAVNKLLSMSEEALSHGIVAASGGNHGVAVAYAGWIARKPAIVYLPKSTPKAKADKLRHWGAEVVIEGDVFDEADAAAQARAEREHMAYIHPFADPVIVAGQGTLGLEMLEEVPDVDTLVLAIGGGGLIGGVSTVVRALKPGVRIIGVEPTGAPTLTRSLEAGHLVTLDTLNTAAGTLALRRSSQLNLDLVREYVDEVVLVSDEEMIEAALYLWFEMALAAEMSGAAAMAALLARKIQTRPDERVCALICGAGLDWMR